MLIYINQCRNVIPYRFGLSTREKSGSIAYMKIRDTNNSGASAICEDGTLQIELRAVDDFIDLLPKIDFIKIDVEGHELFTLQGGETLLDRDRPVLFIELWASMPIESQRTKDWLKERGYQLIHLQNDDYIAVPSLSFEFPKKVLNEKDTEAVIFRENTNPNQQNNIWFILFIITSVLAFIILVCFIVFMILKRKKK